MKGNTTLFSFLNDPNANAVASRTLKKTKATKAVNSKRMLLFKRIMIAIAIILVIAVIAVLSYQYWKGHSGSVPAGTTAATTEPTTTETAGQYSQEKLITISRVRTALLGAGFKDSEFTMENEAGFNASLDKSTTGNGAFTKAGFKTAEEAVAFLSSGKEEAKALLQDMMTQTGATAEQILNKDYLTVVQMNGPFVFPGNTGYENGQVYYAGERDGLAGELILFFVKPVETETGKTASDADIMPVRTACGNGQREMPKPVTPTPTETTTPTTLTPKDPSQDPAAQGNAPIGSGVNQDPGPGKYIAPTDMVKPAETARVNPTQPTEVGVLAPEATPTPTPKPEATPTPTPKPEAGVNPTGSNQTENTGDPGLPSGW